MGCRFSAKKRIKCAFGGMLAKRGGVTSRKLRRYGWHAGTLGDIANLRSIAALPQSFECCANFARNRLANRKETGPGVFPHLTSRPGKFAMLYMSGRVFDESSSQAMGVATGAPLRRRVEYEAMAVAPRWLRR